MKNVDCQWFESKFDDFIESSLSDADSAAAQHHLRACNDCRDNFDIWKGLGVALTKGKVSIEASLFEDVVSGINKRDWGEKKKSSRILIGLAAASLIIGLGSLGISRLLSVYQDTPIEPPQRPLETVTAVKNEPVRKQNGATPLTIELDKDGRRFISPVKGTVLWLSAEAVILKAIRHMNHVWFELEKGTVLAEIGDVPDNFRFQVKTRTKVVEAHGTVFRVTIDGDRNTNVGVLEGKVKITRRDEQLAHSLVLPVGYQYSGRDERVTPLSEVDMKRNLSSVFQSPPPPLLMDRIARSMKMMSGEKAVVATPANSDRIRKSTASIVNDDASAKVGRLLKEAQAFRRESQYKDAVNVYNEIRKKFPNSDAADVASLSLVQLKLGPLHDAHGALEDVTSFLNQPASPALTEQGSVLKLNALAALKHWNEVIRESETLLGSVQNRHIKNQILRLKSEAFMARGDCESASDVYRQILSSDVKAVDAQYANRGLKKCHIESE